MSTSVFDLAETTNKYENFLNPVCTTNGKPTDTLID